MKTEIKYSLIISILVLAWMLLEYFFGFQKNQIWYINNKGLLLLFQSFIPLLFITLAIREKREKYLGGYIIYAKAIKTGLYISMITAVLSVPNVYLLYEVINPSYFPFMIEYSITEMEKSGNNTMQVNEFLHSYYNLRTHLLQGFVGTLSIGIFITLIVSIFLKKNNPENLETTE